MKKYTVSLDQSIDRYLITRQIKSKCGETMFLRFSVPTSYCKDIIKNTRSVRKQMIQQMNKSVNNDTFMKAMLRKIKRKFYRLVGK